MIRAYFTATGPGHLPVTKQTMNSSVNQTIIESNVRSPFSHLKLDSNWVMLQDNNLKHRSNSTTEWLKTKRISQSPDHKLIEILLQDMNCSM